MRHHMRALQMEAPGPAEELRLVERPLPRPGPDEVLLQIHYCGLNPLDVFARAGRANFVVKGWPLVPGIEHSGTVEAVGEGVDPVWVGKRVVSRTSFGGNAEYCVDPVTDIVPIPDELDLLRGTVYRGCSHVAWRILHQRLRATTGQSILVHSAAGPVGIMLTQLARRIGLDVIGLVGSQQKADYARQFGANELLVVGRECKDWATEVVSLTNGQGVDYIVDGNGGTVSDSNLDALAVGGTLVVIGFSAGSTGSAIRKETLLGWNATVTGFNLPLEEHQRNDPTAPDEEIVPAIVAGEVVVPITEVIGLADVPRYHRLLEERRLQGRVVIQL